ncbi:MAG: hypothetical protein QQN43_05885 [Nitrosopumilus sp.]|nr:hypothetical protein [Nitrososphaerota archaeon]
MRRGRPTRYNQNKIEKILQLFYQKGISANATSTKTEINIKTILKYYKQWDKKLVDSDKDFLMRVKITKEQSIQTLDREILSLYDQEDEIESIKNIIKRNGDITRFEKLSRLKLKFSDQRMKILAAKINLVGTPTADTLIEIKEKNDV